MIRVEINFTSNQKRPQPPTNAEDFCKQVSDIFSAPPDGSRRLHTLFVTATEVTWGDLAQYACWIDHDPEFFLNKLEPHILIMHNPKDGPLELVYKCLRGLRKHVGGALSENAIVRL